MISSLPIKFQHQYDITTLYGRWIDVEVAKGLIGNFVLLEVLGLLSVML